MNAMKRVRIAVIGCGAIGWKHMEAARNTPGAELSFLADINGETVRRVAGEMNVANWTQDPAELAGNPDVDAAVLALPASGRTRVARDFLQAGKHVLLEKPAAMNAHELVELKKLIRGPDQVVACASARFRGGLLAMEVQRFLRSGSLGKLRTIQVRATTTAGAPPSSPPPAWRLRRDLNGGGVLANLGVYDLDFLSGVLDWQLRPVEVSAQCWSISERISNWVAENSDAETHVKALVHCQDRILLDYERAEYFGGVPDSTWRITGEYGSLDIPMLSRKGDSLIFHELTASGQVDQILWTAEEPLDVHPVPVRDFTEAILKGRPPLTGIDQSIWITSLVDHIYQSAARNSAVPFRSMLH